jgi:hypothetical protein
MARSFTSRAFTARAFAEYLHDAPVDIEEVGRVRDTLVFDGPQLWPKFFGFIVLLVLAACIATYGLLGNSVTEARSAAR